MRLAEFIEADAAPAVGFVSGFHRLHRVDDVLDIRWHAIERAFLVALDHRHRADERLGKPRAFQRDRLPFAGLAGIIQQAIFELIADSVRVVHQQADTGLDRAFRALPFEITLLMFRAETMQVVGGDGGADGIGKSNRMELHTDASSG